MKTLSASVSRSLHGKFWLCVCELKLSSLSLDLAGRDLNIGLTFRLY